ncbi:MAG: secretin N-terminal domain-containing protein [Candidatus Omnitrophota bacterium]
MKRNFIFNLTLILIFSLGINFAVAQSDSSAGNSAGVPAVFENAISLDVKDMNILDVLRLIAEQSGLNIVASRNIRGNVTVKLQNVQIKDALEAILDSNNFTYVIDGEIMRVYTYQDLQQKSQLVQMKTEVFMLQHAKVNDLKPVLLSIKSPRGRIEIDAKTNQIVVTDVDESLSDITKTIQALDRYISTKIFELNYADAKELHAKLLEVVTKQEGEVFIDVRTNSIIISAIPPVIERAEVLIKSWDKREAQVLIEAKILEISVDESESYGVSWQYQSPGDHGLDIKGTLPFSLAAGGVFKIGTLTADEYNMSLQMLKATTDINLLSAPRITVMNNKEANILVGSSEPYLVTYVDKETQVQSQDTKFQDVGIKLKVTPQISEDDYITMNIHPEVSSARRVAEVNNSLAVDTTQADTTVVVKDGDTIVMGGLIKDKKEQVVTKIPILGDIPILGFLFRSTQDTISKRELIVFITPHILRGHSLRESAIDQAFDQAKEKIEDLTSE